MYYTAIKHTISFPSTNHSPTTPPLGGEDVRGSLLLTEANQRLSVRGKQARARHKAYVLMVTVNHR